jgi:DNA mismatch repair protein MutL
VNLRPVRDRALAKAVSQAYKAAGGGDRGFEAFLFVEVPAHMVDVNVHPAKTEVRFADGRTVWAAVERSVRAALEQGVRELPSVEVSDGTGGRDVPGRAVQAVGAFFERASEPGAGGASRAGWRSGGSPPDRVAEGPGPSEGVVESVAPVVLGQHRLTYIVATDGDELVLVDQHTAHERVRFERLLERAGRHAVESQGLVTPLVLELPPELRPVQDAHAETLAELGFDVEAFGGGSTRLRAVPAMLGQKDPGPALEGILRDLAEREEADWAVAGTRDRLAATLACHSAVRAGQALNLQSMSAIVRDVLQTAHPTLCPHGRPTIVRIPRDEVSRWFGRTGWRRQ